MKPEDTASAIKDLAKRISQGVDAMEVRKSSAPSKLGESQHGDITASTAHDRRRMSIALVDDHMFGHYASTLDGNDALYEEDQGLMSGDDGGYTNYEALLGEDKALRESRTGVYKLLGSDQIGSSDTEIMPANTQRGARKRPRYCAQPVQLECAVKFVRDVRQQLEDKYGPRDVGKLLEVEKRAGDGRFSTAEECIVAVRGLLEEIQGDAFDEAAFDKLANNLKRDMQPDEHVQKALEKLQQLSVGILGSRNVSREITPMETVSDIVDSALPSSSPNAQGEDAAEDELDCWPEDLSEKDSASLAIHGEERCVPLFAESHLPSNGPPIAKQGEGSSQPEPSSLSEMLGNENSILRNVITLEKMRSLKNAILSKKGRSTTPTHTTPTASSTPLEIQNSPSRAPTSGRTELLSGSRQRALGVAVTALVLEHSGFSHSSLRALETLTDAWEQFIERAGARLSSARERIADDAVVARSAVSQPATESDRNALVENAITVVMGTCGVRGGFTDLIPYGRYSARRAVLETNTAFTRLQQICSRLGVDPTPNVSKRTSVEVEPTSQDDVFASLNEASWSFGVLPRDTTLDVLGSIRVPRAVALSALGCPEPGTSAVKQEDELDGADGGQKDVVMRDGLAQVSF